MKKLFWLFLLLITLIVAGIFYFIPTTLTISSATSIHGPAARVTELLASNESLGRWWPEKKKDTVSPLTINNQSFNVTGSSYNLVEVTAGFREGPLKGRIQLAGIRPDSTVAEWTYQTTTGYNPIKRFLDYQAAVSLKENLNSLLLALKNYAEKKENIYGMNIEKLTVKDTVLVATRSHFDHLPTTPEIYGLIVKLRDYIHSENAFETNYPMIHLDADDKNEFNIMVAIPTNRLLKGKGDIELKRMVMGNILVGQFTGGSSRMMEAFSQMEQFKSDYHFTTIAIPFAQLVTDRTKETDSTKWVTTICLPVL